MSLHAVDNVGDAFDAAREFLLPFDRGRWLRLTVISLFVGGVGGFSGFQGGGPGGSPDGTGFTGYEFDPLPGLGEIPLVVFVVVGVVILVGAVLVLVSSVMEFVLIDALVTESVAIRGPFREQFGRGLRLFGFRVALAVAAFLMIALPILAFLGLVSLGIPPIGLILLVPLILLGFVVLGVVHGFTTAFVVPVMLDADTGVIGGWRRFVGVLVSAPIEYLVYLVLSVILGMVGGIGVSILVAITSLVVLIPLGGIALAAFLVAGFTPIGLAVIVPALVLLALLVMVFYAAASVPVLVYLRYYALLELGDTSEHDLIPERRAEIRGS